MLRDEIVRKLFIEMVKDFSITPEKLADKIISLIESKLPEVEEECKGCKGGGQIITDLGTAKAINSCPDCGMAGTIKRQMTLDEGIKELHHNATILKEVNAKIEKLNEFIEIEIKEDEKLRGKDE